jgi:ribose transport system substrate-binding protein
MVSTRLSLTKSVVAGKVGLVTVTLLGTFLVLAGCNRQTGKVVAVVPKGQADVFWQEVHSGAVKAGKEFHVNVAWNGPANEVEYSKQIEIVENFINQRVDGILLAPSERKAMVGVIDKASKSGIPVVIFDSGADTENYVSFVATDNYAGGVLAAKRMGELLSGKGKIAIIATIPGGASTLAREAGFEETLEKEFPDIQVVAKQFGMANYAHSLQVSEDILTANPDLNGIFASNESSSIGVAQAIKARGLVGKIPLVGFDASPALQSDLKAGVFDSLVVQNPYKMGYEGVKALADLWAGHKPARRIDSGVTLVKRDDLAKPEVQTLLNPPLVF